MNIESLPKVLPEWLNNSDPYRSLLFSRVTLVRNIIGFSFPDKSTNDGRIEIREMIENAVSNTLSREKLTIFKMEELSELQRKILFERRLVPKQYIVGNLIGRTLAVSDDETTSIFINYENHLTVQVLGCADELKDSYDKAYEIVTRLSDDLDFAFDKDLGFLTARLSETGTGSHFSQFFHIPVLELEHQTQHIGKGSDEVNLVFERDEHLTSTGVEGFYSVTNVCTLGITENKLIEQMERFSERVVEYEKKMQGIAYIDNKEVYEDKGYRALGTLQNARMLSLQECVRLVSDIRTALILKFLERKIDPTHLLKLLFQIFPAHLSVLLNKPVMPDQTKTAVIRNIEKSRADFLRTLF